VAEPIVTSVVEFENGLQYKLPGRPAIVRVIATDPDSVTIEATFKVTDSQGNATTHVQPVIQTDPLTYEGTVNSPHTIGPLVGGGPHEFVVV